MKFEKKLLTSHQNAIHLYHIIAEGSNEEIGYNLGSLAKDFHGIEKSAKNGTAKVKQQYEYLKRFYPGHYSRMIGFAKAYGESLNSDDFDFSYFGKVPGGTGCSAVHYPPSLTSTGHGYISRNLDFPIPKSFMNENPFFPFKHTYLIEMYPEACFASISLLCFEVFGLALEGINSEGLSVIHLADADTRIDHADLATGKTIKGFNEFLPIQYLLDTCSNADEAMKALQRMEHYHVAIPVHLLIADSKGDSFVFEYSPDGSKKVFVNGSTTAPLAVTNFQLNRLSDPSMKRKIESRPTENGIDRYRILGKQIDSINFPITERLVRETNCKVYVNTDGEDLLERTLFHSIYDTTSCSVKISLLPGNEQSTENFYKLSLKENVK